MVVPPQTAGRARLGIALLVAMLGAGTCSAPSNPTPEPPDVGDNLPRVLVGAGDIGDCETNGAQRTAELLDSIDGVVFTAGDNAYPNGSRRDYLNCYEPSWGRHKDRTRPTPGNHEYETPGAAGYFDYFGDAAGPRGLGYYSYNVGKWRVLALNSEVGVGIGSPQGQWLVGELTANPSRCTIAIWHRPLFSSGPNGPNADMKDFFRLLYDAKVEIVINGHDHLYERFSPQNADGRPEPTTGVRQFTVGTGGTSPYRPAALARNSEVVRSEYGVLRLRLTADVYQWEFISAESSGFRDLGTGTCH